MRNPNTELECFAFDVLGDFVPVSSIVTDEERGAVTIKDCPPSLISIIREDWKRATYRSKYERIRLILIPAA